MRFPSQGAMLACGVFATSIAGCSGGSDNAGEGSDGGAGDATAADAGKAPDAGDGTYPPLHFPEIGIAVPISTQFYFTEGPVWDPIKNVLYFTDINARQGTTVGGAIYRLTLPDTFDVLLQPDGNADGLGLDPQDNLIGAGFVSRDAWRLSSSGSFQTLAPCAVTGTSPSEAGAGPSEAGMSASEAGVPSEGGPDASEAGASTSEAGTDPSEAGTGTSEAGATASEAGTDASEGGASLSEAGASLSEAGANASEAGASPPEVAAGTCYGGQPINTPDDIAARSDGVIYFTDPTFASGSQGFPTLTLPLGGAQGVYRLDTGGALTLEDSTADGPNGVNLSPDEKTLYVSYTISSEVAKFDVAADGSLSNKTTFATGVAIADSMCVDAGGNVYVGTLSGLSVFDPSGKHLGTISVGGLVVTNCAFGGADQRTLFITARTQATLSGAPPLGPPLGGGALYRIPKMPVPGMPGRN